MRAMSTPTSWPLRFITLPAIRTVSTFCGPMLVTTAPTALFIGITLSRSVRSRMMSASLPGVSVPILRSRPLARAFDGGELEHLARRQELGRVLVAGEPPRPHLVLLQREHGAHLLEEIVGHGGFHIHAERRADAGIDRLLDRRVAVPHQHLDIAGYGDGAAGVPDQLPLGVVEGAAVDVGRVRFQRLLRVELL